jgi:hypothetical protein
MSTRANWIIKLLHSGRNNTSDSYQFLDFQSV